MVLRGEVGSQLCHAREMQSAIGEHIEEDGMLPCRSRGGNAEIGLGLGEVEPLRAVGEHRRRGFAGVEPTRVYLADVGDEIGFVAT